MVERRELITICRQIGTMMEVGVDFLRITRALRDQTDNPRLLELYDQLDHEMKMGESLAEAISKAPDVFSPFAVSLVRQGEVRGDIEGAWHRLADFLKQEAQEDKDLGQDAMLFGAGAISSSNSPRLLTTSGAAQQTPLTGGALADFANRVQDTAIRGLFWFAGFLLALAILQWCVELGTIPSRWLFSIQLGVAALFLMGAGSALWVKREAAPARITVCSFCGKAESDALTLQRSPLMQDAAICASCAATVAGAQRSADSISPEMLRDIEVSPASSETQARPRASSEGFTPSPTHEVTEETDDNDPFKL